jgi:hypothetical protein
MIKYKTSILVKDLENSSIFAKAIFCPEELELGCGAKPQI